MAPSDTVVAPRFGTGTVVAPPPTESIFELQGVRKAFDDLVLFDGCSLTVRRGETLSIIPAVAGG